MMNKMRFLNKWTAAVLSYLEFVSSAYEMADDESGGGGVT